MTRRLLGVLAGLAALLVVGVGPASAITHGQLDGDGHPYVGMVVTFDQSGNALELCTGTLLSQRVFLTAGHCTTGAASADIWFDSGPLEFADMHVAGTPMTVSGYVPITHDLGAVVLDEPFAGITSGFPTLPSVNQLDSLKTRRGQQAETFTTIGYGMEKSFPPAASRKDVSDFTRMVAAPRLIQIDGGQAGDFGIVLSNNADTGGVCFGDSGGPNLIGGNVIAGVTVGLKNLTCSGTGLALRLDRQWSIDWVVSLMSAYPS
jgi:Trypsin